MNLEEIQAIKFPDVIDRYSGEPGQPGWKTAVTPVQMLAEIVYAHANAEKADQVVCTVGYVPGETREMREKLAEADKKFGIPPRTYRGHHTLSLWHEEWTSPTRTILSNDPRAEDRLVNSRYVTFLFRVEPDNGLVDWWWEKWGHEYAD